jgi:hypothetical protein
VERQLMLLPVSILAGFALVYVVLFRLACDRHNHHAAAWFSPILWLYALWTAVFALSVYWGSVREQLDLYNAVSRVSLISLCRPCANFIYGAAVLVVILTKGKKTIDLSTTAPVLFLFLIADSLSTLRATAFERFSPGKELLVAADVSKALFGLGVSYALQKVDHDHTPLPWVCTVLVFISVAFGYITCSQRWTGLLLTLYLTAAVTIMVQAPLWRVCPG